MKTKRIPFDLAKARAGAKVVTRCGYSVRLSEFELKNNDGYKLLGIIDVKGNEIPYGFMETGCRSETEESDYDLFIEEEQEKTRREYSGTDSIYVPKDDEGIREELIDAINGLWDNDALPMPLSIKRKDAWLAWLDNKPKFNVGDWVVTTDGKINQVKTVSHDGYSYTLDDNTYFSGSWKDMYHHWSIKDAKPGDILATKNGYIILIFKNIKSSSGSGFSSYYNYNNFSGYSDFKEGSWKRDCFIPATKEQRDLLFKKMKETGYEWDSDRMELKLIENEAVDDNDDKAETEVKKRRMTNQELADWLRKCPEECREFKYKEKPYWVYSNYEYLESEADVPVEKNKLIRRNHGEWQEPLIEE